MPVPLPSLVLEAAAAFEGEAAVIVVITSTHLRKEGEHTPRIL